MSRKFKFLFSFLIIAILLTGVISYSRAQEAPKSPETLEEAKTLGERVLIGFPQALKEPWQQALAVWGKMFNWFKDFYQSYISSWLRGIWYKVLSVLGKEVEKRKPEIQEGFEEEKQEMKEESVKTGKSLWQRFKELIQ